MKGDPGRGDRSPPRYLQRVRYGGLEKVIPQNSLGLESRDKGGTEHLDAERSPGQVRVWQQEPFPRCLTCPIPKGERRAQVLHPLPPREVSPHLT